MAANLKSGAIFPTELHRKLPADAQGGYKGTYYKMNANYFAQNVTEFAGRHNVYDLDTLARLAAVASGLKGRGLRHDDLVAPA